MSCYMKAPCEVDESPLMNDKIHKSEKMEKKQYNVHCSYVLVGIIELEIYLKYH